MADITLSDGREITFDLGALSLREYRALFDKKQPLDEEDAIIAKASGVEVDYYLDLPLDDSKRLVGALIKKARGPIDPN